MGPFFVEGDLHVENSAHAANGPGGKFFQPTRGGQNTKGSSPTLLLRALKPASPREEHTGIIIRLIDL